VEAWRDRVGSTEIHLLEELLSEHFYLKFMMENKKMANKTKPQIARVEQPFGIDPPIVHCPICGQATMKIDEATGGEVTPCNHLAFIYVCGDFEYQSDDFEARVKKVEEAEVEEDWDEEAEEADVDYIEDLLEKTGYGNNMLVIEITYGGMCHGPVCYTDTFGFDYNMMCEE
jgi:hypothetical protein